MSGEAGRAKLSGVCAVCGWVGAFVDDRNSVRESYACGQCKASLRYRHQAEMLLACYSRQCSSNLAELCAEAEFAALRILEPGIIGPFRRYLRKLAGYLNCYFWDDVPRGEEKDGVRSEDLEALTFEDESFDLVITSDILEHVRQPLQALQEIHRVLAPGGHHIFTVPFPYPPLEKTRPRVDVSGPEDRHILPPVYHGSPTSPEGSLVYNDFGLDLVAQLRDIGFETSTPRALEYNITFICRRSSRP